MRGEVLVDQSTVAWGNFIWFFTFERLAHFGWTPFCPPVSAEMHWLRTAAPSDQSYTKLHPFYLVNWQDTRISCVTWVGAVWDRVRQLHCIHTVTRRRYSRQQWRKSTAEIRVYPLCEVLVTQRQHCSVLRVEESFIPCHNKKKKKRGKKVAVRFSRRKRKASKRLR